MQIQTLGVVSRPVAYAYYNSLISLQYQISKLWNSYIRQGYVLYTCWLWSWPPASVLSNQLHYFLFQKSSWKLHIEMSVHVWYLCEKQGDDFGMHIRWDFRFLVCSVSEKELQHVNVNNVRVLDDFWPPVWRVTPLKMTFGFVIRLFTVFTHT
jgi:hypothetical protein